VGALSNGASVPLGSRSWWWGRWTNSPPCNQKRCYDRGMSQGNLLGRTASWLEPNTAPFPPRAIVGEIVSVTRPSPDVPATIAVAERGDGELHYVTLDGSIPVWIVPVVEEEAA